MPIVWCSLISGKTPIEYPYAERRLGLRSQRLERRLVEPRAKFKTFAARFFGCVSPKWWNILPNALKNINSTEEFRSKLKTYLFREEYMSRNHAVIL